MNSIDPSSDNESIINKIEKNSLSTIQSKKDQAKESQNSAFIFKLMNDEDKLKKSRKKKLPKFEPIYDRKLLKLYQKSHDIKFNIKRILYSKSYSSCSYSSFNSSKYNNSSHYSNSGNTINYYPYEINEIISKKYVITKHISDGTFGRVLEVKDISTNNIYALKILVSKEEILKWWQFEKNIIDEISKQDKFGESNCVKIVEDFYFIKNEVKYYGYVFELLGLSLYEFLKMNSFNGFNIVQIQNIAKQILQGVNFLHKLHIVHTDLKPENILFVDSAYDKTYIFPKNVPNKNNGYYYKVKNSDIKIIDFGSAIRLEKDKNSYGIINTRQYRSPEVILQ